jgi:hypothetical protein
MSRALESKAGRLAPFVVLGTLTACSGGAAPPDLGPSTFEVTITAVNGNTDLPTAEMPLPANRGDVVETWDFTIEARSSTGELEPFDGVVRLSARPGTIYAVTGEGALGRNIQLAGGKAVGQAQITAVYGPSRLWVEDIGYTPFTDPDPDKKPACSNGADDDGDKAIDFPSDPGCAFADDDDEGGGTFSAGVSPPVQYALPKVSDVRGTGSGTPYPFEAIEVNTGDPQRVVVTRVASDGFYVTDVNPTEAANGYNSVFAFNFNTPPGMRVCDRLTYFSGTANDFFGFTEMNFPSYEVSFPLEGEKCEVPEPAVILTDQPADCQSDADCSNRFCEFPDPQNPSQGKCKSNLISDAVRMQSFQSSLVRLENVTIAKNFGPGLAKNNVFKEDASSCDFNGDGQIDFESADEGTCASVCDADPNCSEWTAFSARGDVKVSRGSAASMLKISTGTVAGFDPVGSRGQVIRSITGTLRKFSGGTLNWTVETRCPDDLACPLPGCGAAEPISSQTACVRLRTISDNDQGTN